MALQTNGTFSPPSVTQIDMTGEFYFGAMLLVIGLAFAWYVFGDGSARELFKPSDRKTTPAMRPSVRYAVAVLGSVLVANIAALQAWPGQSWYIAGAVASQT
jgi:hypothetical protein